MKFLIGIFIFLTLSQAMAELEGEVPINVRAPASANETGNAAPAPVPTREPAKDSNIELRKEQLSDSPNTAVTNPDDNLNREFPLVDEIFKFQIDRILDDRHLEFSADKKIFAVGEAMAVQSQNSNKNIIGFIRITEITEKLDGTLTVQCVLLRQSRVQMIRAGDWVVSVNFAHENDEYRGTSELLVHTRQNQFISAKYRPIFYQGVSAGETAQTLWENEYLVTFYGLTAYGVKDWLTLESILTADVVGAYNASIKGRIYDSLSNTISIGTNVAHVPNENKTTMNLSFFWDSFSSEKTVTHTLITLALFSFENANNATAIKSLGTSSLQSGYEFILDDWNRVLAGPSYNFDNKAVGGYITYLRIWDRFHLSGSFASTNIQSMKFSPVDGYYVTADAYWRF
jgi:hypothetical protein